MPPPGTEPKTGRFEGGGSVTFGFLNDVNSTYAFKIMTSAKNPWYAELTLQVKDVAALLKNGLFWSEANIDSTKNFFSDDYIATPPGSEWMNSLYCHGRYYQLMDTEPAQWHGTLTVRAHEVNTLRQFRPSQLSLENVRYMSAKNTHGHTVYYFDSLVSDECFNAIYDDTPSKGWWPWPKKEGIDNALTEEKLEDNSAK